MDLDSIVRRACAGLPGVRGKRLMMPAFTLAAMLASSGGASAQTVILANVRYYGDLFTAYWDGNGYVQGRDVIGGPSGSRGGAADLLAFASYSSALAPFPSILASASDEAPPSPLMFTASAYVHSV